MTNGQDPHPRLFPCSLVFHLPPTKGVLAPKSFFSQKLFLPNHHQSSLLVSTQSINHSFSPSSIVSTCVDHTSQTLFTSSSLVSSCLHPTRPTLFIPSSVLSGCLEQRVGRSSARRHVKLPRAQEADTPSTHHRFSLVGALFQSIYDSLSLPQVSGTPTHRHSKPSRPQESDTPSTHLPSSQVVTSKAVPSQVVSSQVLLSQVVPTQVALSQSVPFQAAPSQVVPSKRARHSSTHRHSKQSRAAKSKSRSLPSILPTPPPTEYYSFPFAEPPGAMAVYSTMLIPGPDFSVDLSVVDLAVPPIYSRRVLIFSRDDRISQHQTITAIQNGLRKTVDQIPILAGLMSFSFNQGWTVSKGNLRLRLVNIDLDYAVLKASNFSEDMLPAHLISSVPTLSDPQGEWDTCRIQVNFIRGGLLVVISVHHLIMDGWGTTKVIEAISKHCRFNPGQPSADLGSSITLRDDEYMWRDRSRLSQTSIPGGGDASKVTAYSIVPASYAFAPAHPGIVTKTFSFGVAALRHLKATAFPDQRQFPGEWITTHDALLALWMQNYVRTRREAGLLQEKEEIRFSFPVEFRRLVYLPATYLGNAVMMIKVRTTVDNIMGPGGLQAAAHMIRQASINTTVADVDNFIAVAKVVQSNPSLALRINIKFEGVNTAFGCTSYKNFAHGALDWDSQVFGTYERLRLPSGIAGEGMTIVMPVLRDGS